MNEATARPYSHPAPYDGWNARGNLSNMQATEAIVMDNLFPDVQQVRLRRGEVTWSTGFTNPVRTLLAYSGAVLSRLYAATNDGIFNVTASGAIGAAEEACTNGEFSYVNFTTPGGSFLVAANGVNAVKNYNGTTWTDPAITGVSSSSLRYVTSHQKRLWFTQNDSMSLWYLPVESIAGAATQFPVGSLFKFGGSVAAIGSWTLDTGVGLNDLFVIVTTAGQIAVYQGSDPDVSASWALVGVYSVPLPLGSRPLLDYGGDLLYLSQNGVIPLSELAQSVIIDRSKQVSFRIDGAFLDAAFDYKNNPGWQMVLHKTENFLLVNVPVSTDTVAYQFVMNTITRAWCRFTGWNASCWATLGADLFYAGGLTVHQAWQGLNDSGAAIQAVCAQAYTPLGARSQKAVTLVRPHIGFSGAAQLGLALDTDFQAFQGQSLLNYASMSSGSLWNSGVFNTATWGDDAARLQARWLSVPGDLGYLHSFRLQIGTSQSTFAWTATDFVTRSAGIL